MSFWWKAWKAATTLDRSTPTSTSGVGKNWQWTWFGSDCPFFRQGFDAPFKFWNRKNEVFLVKNDWSINVRFLLFLPNPHLTNNWYCIPIQETREWSKLKVYYKLYSLCRSINKRLIVPTIVTKKYWIKYCKCSVTSARHNEWLYINYQSHERARFENEEQSWEVETVVSTEANFYYFKFPEILNFLRNGLPVGDHKSDYFLTGGADSTDSNPCLSHSATPYGQLLLNNNKWEQITPQIKVSEWVANSKQLRCFQNSLYILQIDLAIRFVFVNLDVKRWRLWYSAWPAAYCHLRCFRSLCISQDKKWY